jgi:hypothetical protein
MSRSGCSVVLSSILVSALGRRCFLIRRLSRAQSPYLGATRKCADIICDFCGYLAQVKTATVPDVMKVPTSILGAAWRSQYERMKAGIYFPLFIVLRNSNKSAVYYLPTEFQIPSLFKKRAPLSATARRAGWQGFSYDLSSVEKAALVRILSPGSDKFSHGRRRKMHMGLK